ncbi:MAG: hypothetical protein Q4D02_01115, partial [Clostridia bacterium]|nr:hypothetical protein [Clostridia bacterium]
MKQGEDEKPKGISKQKVKRKRQTSIITVFLWLFLIAMMITITATSMKNKNALEVEDNNWNIQLVMYDRSSDMPNQAITDFTWNATSSNDTKQLVMQINYACTTGKVYQPGEIVIEIPGIAKDDFSEYWRKIGSSYSGSYEAWLQDNVVIAADKDTDTTKQYDWSYHYDKTNNIYIFTNNKIIEENEHFEGTVQIAYNLLPRLKIQTDLEFQAKIKENISNAEEIIVMNSNVCNFHYVAIKRTYNLTKYAIAGAKADYTKIDDILDDYYWVRYHFQYDYSADGSIDAYDENDLLMRSHNRNYQIIKEELPEDCVMYDNNFNKIEPIENNVYCYLKDSREYYMEYYYVGYPKSKYNEGDKITNIAELWGRYEDEDEMQKLSESSTTVSLVKFDFEYKGELYQITKTSWPASLLNKNKLKNGGDVVTWRLFSKAFYTDSVMDVEIGDDLLYITRENGDITKLEDDEYHFTKVILPVFRTYNKYNESAGEALIGYPYEIQVRYKNTNEYVVYRTGTTSDNEQNFDNIKGTECITFNTEDIVGIKVVIKDLNKTLYLDSTTPISIKTDIHPKNCKEGYAYNFDYLQVYSKDENGNRSLVNEPTLGNYITPSTLKIAEYDQNMYGLYMQRGYSSVLINNGRMALYNEKYFYNLTNNTNNRRYDARLNLSNTINIDSYDVDKDCIIKTYDILPEGMNLTNEQEIINNSTIEGSYQYLRLKDGTEFNSKSELENYIKENISIQIDYNYKNSGRTKIQITYDLNDLDFSYYKINILGLQLRTVLNVEIPYDSILEYGTTYRNYMYSMWNNQEYEYAQGKTISDNGLLDMLAEDIDEDGIINERLQYGMSTLNINFAVSSQQAVIKQVRTDLTKGAFVEGTAEATAGSEYTYKLRVTTGANSLKDLILYDTLETIYDENGNDISSGWKGEFVGVDTTYAESKGYAPVVYYSEEQNPGKLTEVPDKWKV